MSKREELVKLGDAIAEAAAHIDAAMYRLLEMIREFDAAGGWYEAGAKTCAHWLSWRIGWDLATAREHVRVARRLADLPRMAEVLRTGVVSYSKVRAMTRVATPATEETLVMWAQHSTAAQMENICRKYQMVKRLAGKREGDDESRRYVNRTMLDDGMVKITAVLRPDEAATVMGVIEQAAKRVAAEASGDVSAETPDPDEHRRRAPSKYDRANGLMAVAETYARGTSPDRAPVELVVRVTRDALAGAAPGDVSAETSEAAPDAFDELAELADGAWISQQAARRLACDAGVVDVVESPDGDLLSVGRKRRTVPAPMKRALLERDRTCRFPGCSNRLFVQAHHIKHWVNGGETRLTNLVAICSFHHTFVHEHGYSVRFEDGEPVFYQANGYRAQPVPRRCHLTAEQMGWPAIRYDNDEAGLDIDADTNLSRWDGENPDYDMAVSGLYRLDHVPADPNVDRPSRNDELLQTWDREAPAG